MDRRTEPRFSISAPVKVTLLSSLDRQIDCRVVDLSATGMRFIASEVIAPDEMVALDFEDHLAVASVRNCQPYGGKFSVGTSRIHELPKDQLPAGQPRYEQIRALLEEKGWLVEIETEDAEPPASAEPTPAEPAPQPAAEVEAVAEPEAEVETVAEPEPEPVIPTAEPAPLAASPFLVPTSVPVPDPVQAETPEPVIVPEVVAPPKAEAPEAPPRPVSAPIPPAPPPASSRVPMAIALAVLVIGAGALVLRPKHPPSKRDSVAAAATAPEALPVLAEEAPKPSSPEPPSKNGKGPSAKPPAAAAGSNLHQVHLASATQAWVSATADGKVVIARTLEKGAVGDFQFSKISYVHLGNSGVDIALDGKPVHLASGSNGLRLVEITPDGARILPWTNNDPPSAPASK